jgi:outer membrane biosynthesis protein TonB
MSSMELNLSGENENKKVGMIVSVIAHLLLLLILFLPFLSSELIPPGQKGIVIQFGTLDAGDEDASEESQASTDEITQENESVAPQEVKAKDSNQAAVKSPPQEQKEQKEVIVDNTSTVEAEAERKRNEEAAAAKKKADEEKARIAEAERIKAEEEAQRKKQLEERKKKYGDILSGGQNKGETSGDRGDPTGDPDRSALDNIAKGSGKVGGGLTNRGVVYEPKIQENSQMSGTVVIDICVDVEGQVVSAKFTQRGSTTTEKSLVDVAIAGAKQYKFTPSEIEKQCGTVTVNFIVR